MRYSFSLSWVLVLAISFTLDCPKYIVESSRLPKGLESPEYEELEEPDDHLTVLRQKRTVKFDDIPTSIKKRLVENLQIIADAEANAEDEDEEYLDKDYKGTIRKREVTENHSESEVNQDLHLESDKNDGAEGDIFKNTGDLERAKSELRKVENQVEDEILTLKKRSDVPDVIHQLENVQVASSVPRSANNANHNAKELSTNSDESASANHKNGRSIVAIPSHNKQIYGKRFDNPIRHNHSKAMNENDFQRVNIRELKDKNDSLDELNKMRVIRSPKNAKESQIEKHSMTNHKKMKKSIFIPEKAQKNVGDKLPSTLALNSEVKLAAPNRQTENKRQTRKLKKSDSKKPNRHAQKLRIHPVSPKKRRNYRRKTLVGFFRLNNAGKGQRNTGSSNFMFPGQLKKKKEIHSKNASSKNKKNKGKSKHKLTHIEESVARAARAADEREEVNSNALESNDIDNTPNAQDQAKEYNDAFGGLPNGPGNSRYKRIKRFKAT